MAQNQTGWAAPVQRCRRAALLAALPLVLLELHQKGWAGPALRC